MLQRSEVFSLLSELLASVSESSLAGFEFRSSLVGEINGRVDLLTEQVRLCSPLSRARAGGFADAFVDVQSEQLPKCGLSLTGVCV